MTQYVHEKVQTMERPTTVWLLLAIAFLLVAAYGYFVNSAIVNIVSTKGMQAKIAELTSTVGSLEAEYLAAKSSLTMDDARALGLSEAGSQISYVARSAQAFSVNR